MKTTYKIFSLRYVVYSLVIILSTSTYGLVHALNTISTWFQTTWSLVSIDAHNNCRQVRHTWGQSYFVPTRTAAEWQAFRQNAPSDVVLDSCIDRYPGCDTDDITVWSYTIAACNVGATTAWITSVSYGRLFQWWEDIAWDTSSGLTAANNCTWDRDTQSCTTPSLSAWSSSVWDTTSWGTDRWLDYGDTRWPCAPWYRVPSVTDWQGIVTAGGWGSDWAAMQTALQLPYAGNRFWSDGTRSFGGSFGYYWSSSPSGTFGHYLHFNSSYLYPAFSSNRALGLSVRCFKN